jgi:hypothetical protein
MKPNGRRRCNGFLRLLLKRIVGNLKAVFGWWHGWRENVVKVCAEKNTLTSNLDWLWDAYERGEIKLVSVLLVFVWG